MGEHGEIDSQSIPGGAERIRIASFEPVRKRRHQWPSGARMTAPKGGNVRSSDCGYPCFGWSVASTTPEFPTFVPPYNALLVFRRSIQRPARGTPRR